VKYLAVEPDEALDPGLRADLLDTWIATTDAGGRSGGRLCAPAAYAESVAVRISRTK